MILYPLKRCFVLSFVMVLNLKFKLKEIAKELLDTSTSLQQSANNREIYFLNYRFKRNVNYLVCIKMTIESWNIMNDFILHLKQLDYRVLNV